MKTGKREWQLRKKQAKQQKRHSQNAEKPKVLETPYFKIDLTPLQANFAALDDRMSNRLRCDYVTLTIFFRLFIPAMFPQYSEGIYINSDMVLLP